MLPVPNHLSVVVGCGWSHCACKMYLSGQRALICNTLTMSGHGKIVLHQQCCVKQYTTVERGKKMYS